MDTLLFIPRRHRFSAFLLLFSTPWLVPHVALAPHAKQHDFTLVDAWFSGLAVSAFKSVSLLKFNADQDKPIVRYHLKTELRTSK